MNTSMYRPTCMCPPGFNGRLCQCIAGIPKKIEEDACECIHLKYVSGHFCERITCANGGRWDQDRQSCIGCKPLWSGQFCHQLAPVAFYGLIGLIMGLLLFCVLLGLCCGCKMLTLRGGYSLDSGAWSGVRRKFLVKQPILIAKFENLRISTGIFWSRLLLATPNT